MSIKIMSQKGRVLSEYNESKGFAPIIIILGIVLLLGVAGGAYYIGKFQTPKPRPQNPVVTSQAPQSVSSPSASPDETANWKTYTNAKYKFSFKYPKEASIVGDVENTQANKILGQVVSIAGTAVDFTISYDLGAPKESVIKSDENININDNFWVIRFDDPKGNCSPGLGPCLPTLDYQTIKDGNLVTLTFRGDYPDRKIPTQILSTFKFTN